MAALGSPRVGLVSPFALAGLLLAASFVGNTASGSSLLPFSSVERWDFTTEWFPILEDAARFSLQTGALPHGRMDVAKLHPADCRVASTVRYDVDIGLGDAPGDVSASATFYDPPIQWSPLAGVATHSDSLWRDAVSSVGPASSRPQLLQLPDGEASHGRRLAAATTAAALQHAPLAPTDVPSTLDVAVPSGVRIWNEDSELRLRPAGSDWRDLADAKTGDELRSVLVQGLSTKPALRAKGVESLALREPVPITDGQLAVGDTVPVHMDLVGEEIQVESAVDALPVQRKGAHANGGASKLQGNGDRTWWDLVVDPETAWADPRIQAVQSIIDAAEKSTGIKASSLNKVSARPVMMLSLAFDANAEEPMLRDLPVREIKKAMSERGISFKTVGPEKGDLVMAARAGGMSAGGGTVRHRVEAVVEGNPGEISRGEPGFTVISIATRDTKETTATREEHVAALRAGEAEQAPQWWKPSSPTKGAAPALPGNWSPHRTSALQRASYRLLTQTAGLLRSVANLDQMSLAEISRLIAGAALLAAAVLIAGLELYGRRPAALVQTLPDPPVQRAAVSSETSQSVGPATPAATHHTTSTSPGRPGGRVAFKNTVRVRRFIEDATELHERRKYWRALSARNAANRRASRLQNLTLRIENLDRALSSESISLATWLAGLDAEFALPKFESEGFTTLSDLLRANVGSEDLEMMGITDAALRARVMASLHRESVVS